MIIDSLHNSEKYKRLGQRLSAALTYLGSTNFMDLETGEHSIDGKDVFAIVSDYNLKPVTQGQLEAHRSFIDIQYIAHGTESIGYAPYAGQEMVGDYNEAGDYSFYAGSSSLMLLEQGMFAIFFPKDLHMPGIGDPNQRVRKVVVKVRV